VRAGPHNRGSPRRIDPDAGFQFATKCTGSIDFGTPQPLFPAYFDAFGRAYEISRDGQRFLVATPANPGGTAITVVLNWQTVLKQ
jgi:hypothetical protein